MHRMIARALCITLLLALTPFVIQQGHGTEAILEESLNQSLTTDQTSSLANLTIAGGSGVAIVGEPTHVGDNLLVSVLVSNRGSDTGSAVLNLENTNSGFVVSGNQVEITSGSSREVSVTFSPETNGSLSHHWWLTSSDSQVDASLNGDFVVEVYQPQSTEVSVESYEWSLEGGLSIDASMTLSSGRSRPLLLEISKEHHDVRSLMQSFTVELDPGRRSITIELGHPEAEAIFLELIPQSWVADTSFANSTYISLIAPSPEPSVSFVVSTPELPEAGEKVLIEFLLSNDGNSATSAGKARLVLSSDHTILSETSVPSVPSQGSFSSVMEIPAWPDGNVVDFDLEWMMGEVLATSSVSIESEPEAGGFELPFDSIAAIYGALAGIAVILAARVTWRTVSSRTPSTARGGLRAPREPRTSRGEQAKREVSCPHCEQRLNVPASHSGEVKCPACTMQFEVGGADSQPTVSDRIPEAEDRAPIPDPQIPANRVSRSSDDLLQCPDCGQTLRVPIERRPVRSRCPVCKLEFMAEASEE